MKVQHTFAVSAIIRSSRVNKKGEVPIYVRIIVNGKACEISTKHLLKLEQWDSANGKARGRDKLSKAINETIDLIKLKAKQQYNKWLESENELNLDTIKNGILGIEEKQPTLLEVFTEMVSDIKAKIGVNFSKSCYCAYVASEGHIRRYINASYNADDIRLRDLNYKFIAGFEVYLKTEGEIDRTVL